MPAALTVVLGLDWCRLVDGAPDHRLAGARVAKRPPWQGGFTWETTKDGKPWIATSCQGEGADLWWPCKDHPSDKPAGMDLHITVPKGLVVARNGTLQSDVAKGGKRTFHWRIASPISNYCVALNIAPYARIDDTYTCVDGTRMPVQFFALPENEAKARKILPQFLDHLRCFEELLGPYPFRHEKYGIAETPHLGMEHQTIIAYGNGYRDMRYDWLHNHELAHEWWANLVTCRDWKDMWLHESFGTYMQPLYLERLLTVQPFQGEETLLGSWAAARDNSSVGIADVVEVTLPPVAARLPAGSILRLRLRNHWLRMAPQSPGLETAPLFTPFQLLIGHGDQSVGSWLDLPLAPVSPKLVVDRTGMDLATLPPLHLTVRGGLGRAGKPYFVTASASGQVPGAPYLNDVLPLEVDWLTGIVTVSWLLPQFAGFLGDLDGNGDATAVLDLSALAPFPPQLSGLKLTFAGFVWDGLSSVSGAATNAVDVILR